MKKITSVSAVGHSIIVEMLTEQEAACSPLYISQDPSKQAYVLDIGPGILNADKPIGLKVANRVLLQGTYTPLPIKSNSGRVLGAIDLHNIKAILNEDDE